MFVTHCLHSSGDRPGDLGSISPSTLRRLSPSEEVHSPRLQRVTVSWSLVTGGVPGVHRSRGLRTLSDSRRAKREDVMGFYSDVEGTDYSLISSYVFSFFLLLEI